MRWVDAYFPFTEPSLELEIFFNNNWLEVLGCGVLRDRVVEKSGKDSNQIKGWAFGIGLERLAMKLFNIPDIRLFWSNDDRFLKQFKDESIVTFKPYTKYPPCYKDISFYIPNDFNENDLFEVIRNVAGDLVEDVKCVDSFFNKKLNKTSKCFRILYASMDRNLTNQEVEFM
jgi:phenylalanyl-tRNA synthetase alpha chain